MTRASVGVVSAAVLLSGAAVVASKFAFFVLPLTWTGEAERLFAALALAPGRCVADIGAGQGRLAVEMARRLGPAGRVYATELGEPARAGIRARADRAGVAVDVRHATAETTGLDPASCDAAYLRAVFHHIEARRVFVASVAKAVRPGGRIAIIDFPPGALWFHGADHGVSADDVREVFWDANWTLVERVDDWGGGMYLLVFERPAAAR